MLSIVESIAIILFVGPTIMRAITLPRCGVHQNTFGIFPDHVMDDSSEPAERKVKGSYWTSRETTLYI